MSISSTTKENTFLEYNILNIKLFPLLSFKCYFWQNIKINVEIVIFYFHYITFYKIKLNYKIQNYTNK